MNSHCVGEGPHIRHQQCSSELTVHYEVLPADVEFHIMAFYVDDIDCWSVLFKRVSVSICGSTRGDLLVWCLGACSNKQVILQTSSHSSHTRLHTALGVQHWRTQQDPELWPSESGAWLDCFSQSSLVPLSCSTCPPSGLEDSLAILRELSLHLISDLERKSWLDSSVYLSPCSAAILGSKISVAPIADECPGSFWIWAT